MPKVLVTGGAGYIGSHTILDLIENGFDVVSIDNFSRSDAKTFDRIHAITGKQILNYKVDLCDFEELKKVFDLEDGIDGIIHFAAYKSVNESVVFPIRYYENNLTSLINMLKCVEEYQIKNFVFSSSCSVYGNVKDLPVTELTPLSKPECAYAATKQMGEQIIYDFSKHQKVKAILLRYFNPVGAHTSGLIGEVPYDKPNNLVPVITQTAIGFQQKMFVWGDDYPTRDGSCIRDYIHVMDLASAHTLALTNMVNQMNSNLFEILNVGSGNGVSVLEVIKSFEKVSGTKLNYEVGRRRQGDVVSIYANHDLITQKLGWTAKYNLDDMMRTAWAWEKRMAAERSENIQD